MTTVGFDMIANRHREYYLAHAMHKETTMNLARLEGSVEKQSEGDEQDFEALSLVELEMVGGGHATVNTV